MCQRFASRNKFKQFSELRQRLNEDADDWRIRLERHYNRLRGSTGALTPSDMQMLRERYIQGLGDQAIRLRIREENTSYEDISSRVRQLHNAKKDETAAMFLEDQISNLTQQVAALQTSKSCSHCGSGHDTLDCRASGKTRAAFNKRRNSGRNPRYNDNYFIPSRYTRDNPRPPPARSYHHPPAYYPNQRRRVTFQRHSHSPHRYRSYSQQRSRTPVRSNNYRSRRGNNNDYYQQRGNQPNHYNRRSRDRSGNFRSQNRNSQAYLTNTSGVETLNSAELF